MNEDTAAGLGVVCEHAGDIRDRLEPVPGGPELVDAVLGAARGGGDASAELAGLQEALAALDGRGLAAHADGVRLVGSGGAGVAGTGLPRPASALYGCPQGKCARTWEPTPAEDVPVCLVSGACLRPPRRR
ncbi:hypothetical protein KGD83_21325 [Nocardiopsis akebiae]|uniref:Uncharacterized protein n=1 Tax=Nocardiopsis akebiae TaxID=2831968 RepID=A0ABX8C5F8_9ACTN|nr:hypothetical protein [Nocardiopsis akebiae]QUX27803.1 hypothetical protein KGD83_21325 [Nocardiopsis akebiae]